MDTLTTTADAKAAPSGEPERRLPPGQRRLDWFPRFGVDLTGPPPTVPEHPTLTVAGAVREQVEIPLDALAALPRVDRRTDFHCVSGWTVTDLDWSGWVFADVYRALIEPLARPDAPVTHLRFVGLDRIDSVVLIDDALASDVMLADRLGGVPLSGGHGAPIRLVSPSQYGYVSVKHLCRIELHTSPPSVRRSFLDALLHAHPRARVWEEERHGVVPGRIIRLPYRAIKSLMLRRARPG